MAYKPRHRYVAYPGINYRGHMFTGTEWDFVGKNDVEYTVTLEERGFSCHCAGFTFHGKCRHIRHVAESLLGNASIHTRA